MKTTFLFQLLQCCHIHDHDRRNKDQPDVCLITLDGVRCARCFTGIDHHFIEQSYTHV